ncbi:helix-turn-helix domain-containing protein [Clostridioides difficile]|uniref:helix-turn-helix domain-containing protein n=1 Tax=Clostridioides difficile TaxID=1496 RepID=UPI00103530EB|nr:helix-turn-helix transcriptional regulator [Clostridioides difficile]EKS6824022.1 helix-turn-helix transcriptional regulator [Clostridioides difficile]MBY2757210.1 helix-turn-helix domain-containing protein [Clostridioides difficile]MCK1916790.1 helix-turn-helix domain-containing protein [Clostridioides difficile]MDN9172624.1 helix-turn-helix domain-containing protein [Clostridioides difficile]HBG1230868.1 helix-turn-helix transcriptional regulator [Clostridioides difficile]
MSKFYERLAQLRKEHNLTQMDLAKIINKQRSTIAGYETDRKQPDFDTLCTLANYFEVSIDYLLGFTEDKKTYDSPLEDLEIDDDVKKITDIIFKLDEEDREAVFKMLNALTKKYK